MDISQGLFTFMLGSSFSLFLSHTFLLSYLVHREDTLHFQAVGSKFIQGFFALVLTPILENFLKNRSNKIAAEYKRYRVRSGCVDLNEVRSMAENP